MARRLLLGLPIRIGLTGCVLLSSGCGSGSDYVSQLGSGAPEQRAQAAEFLGAQRVAEAIPALRVGLRDTVAEVRAKAAWALGMLCSKEALPDLLQVLRDPSRRVRQQTVWALMQVEEPEAVPALQVAEKIEKDAWIREDMRRAIQYLVQFCGDVEVNESTFR